MTPTELLQLETASSATAAKLSALRGWLADHQLDAYLVPSGDEHLNEYVPAAKQRRAWISGFTGSAGDCLIGQTQTWVFVDSRYYEQSDREVQGTEIQVAKLGLDGQPTLQEVLETWSQAKPYPDRFRLGFDPFTLSIAQFQDLQRQLDAANIEFVALLENLIDQVRNQAPWTTTEPWPAYATSPIFAVPSDYTGDSVAQKLDRVRAAMQKSRVDVLPLTKLDQIAWLFNLRGWDVDYNPVFIAYAIVTAAAVELFTNLERLDEATRQTLPPEVLLRPYEQYSERLITLIQSGSAHRIWLDPRHTTVGTQQILLTAAAHQGATLQVVEANNPVEGMKARKHPTEIEQMQLANLKASRAKTRTLKWIADNWQATAPLSERDLANAIERYYQAETGFQGLSFNTIAATGANSSIVHYGTPSAEARLQPGDLVLLDSGCQYLGGTTDDTRTIVVGEPTPEQIERYTEVLKAHINCAMQRFPKGSTGSQLDGVARASLWTAGLDYGHGTGHGVGAFLNVHEGPNGISKRVQEPLEPGMITSIEPGFYQPGWGGIRLENLYVVVELPSNSAAADPTATRWYGFESLTYIPFDARLIDYDRLDDRQQQWLKRYNRAIVEKLSPDLSQSEVEWLQSTCHGL